MTKVQIKYEKPHFLEDFFSIMEQFLLLTALIHNFYKNILKSMKVKEFGLKRCSRVKTFVFKYISVPAKWIRTARRYVLNIYTTNHAYMDIFNNEFG